MKRKIIQIAGSTYLVSLPREWIKRYNINKGEEVDVREEQGDVIVSTEKGFHIHKAELNVDDLSPMIVRCFHALYKKGVDEIKITYSNSKSLKPIQESLGKEAVGYEIIEQGKNSCLIKHISGEFEEFNPILRRTFRLLISMAEESLDAIKKSDFEQLKNVAFLEEANNRFTTSCRRYLNRGGEKNFKKIGPMYYIVEDLENLADQYKYLCNFLIAQKEKKKIKSLKLSKETLELYEKTNEFLKNFYELFYKYDKEKVVNIGKNRKEFVKEAYDLFDRTTDPTEKRVIHHMLVMTQKVFNFVGPYLVMQLGFSNQQP